MKALKTLALTLILTLAATNAFAQCDMNMGNCGDVQPLPAEVENTLADCQDGGYCDVMPQPTIELADCADGGYCDVIPQPTIELVDCASNPLCDGIPQPTVDLAASFERPSRPVPDRINLVDCQNGGYCDQIPQPELLVA